MKQVLFAAVALIFLSACQAEEEAEYSLIGTQGMMKAISVPAERADDRENYQRIIEAECPRRGFCMLWFFEGLSSVSYPLSDADAEAQTAQYNRNPNSGMDQLLLACRLGDFPADQCF